jgi:hypothetical protein
MKKTSDNITKAMISSLNEKAKSCHVRDIHKPIHSSSAVFYGITHLDRAIEAYSMNLDVDFQRGYVWTRKQQRLFVGHVLEGGEVSPLILNAGPRDRFIQVCDLIDGKQRLTACLSWAKGDIDAELYNGHSIWAGGLDEIDKRICSMTIGLKFAIVNLTRQESLELYLRLNRGGVVHTDEEIKKVRLLLEEEKEKRDGEVSK